MCGSFGCNFLQKGSFDESHYFKKLSESDAENEGLTFYNNNLQHLWNRSAPSPDL